MEDRHFKAFTVIAAFVDDLHSVFAKGKTPLDLYHRLSEHIKAKDTKAISRVVLPFEEFVKEHRSIIESGELLKLPRGTIIPYKGSERVYIEIQKFIFQGDSSVKSNIHRHLLAISAILTPDDKILKEFEDKMSEDTPEAQMINNVVEKLQDRLGDSEVENPMTAISQVLNGGLITDLFSSMQQGIGSGELDIQQLVGTLQTTLGALSDGSTTPLPEKPKIEDVTDSHTAIAFGCRSPESKGVSKWDGAYVWADKVMAVFEDEKDFVSNDTSYEKGVEEYQKLRAKGWNPMTSEDIRETTGVNSFTLKEDSELYQTID